jgi:hypothetical protein
MLGQAREALLFAQCPAAVAKVRQAIRSTEGALRTAKRRVQSSQVACSRAHPMGQPPVSWRRTAFDDAPEMARKRNTARLMAPNSTA